MASLAIGGRTLAIDREKSRDLPKKSRDSARQPSHREKINGLCLALGLAARIDKRRQYPEPCGMAHDTKTRHRALKLLRRGVLLVADIVRELKIDRKTIDVWAAMAGIGAGDSRRAAIDRELLRTDPNRGGGGEDRGKREVERRYARKASQ